MFKKILLSCFAVFLCSSLVAAPAYSEKDGIIISYEQKDLAANQDFKQMGDAEKKLALKQLTDMVYSKEFVDLLIKEMTGSSSKRNLDLSQSISQKISTGKDNPLLVITSIVENRASKLVINLDKQGKLNMIMCVQAEQNNTSPISLTSGPCAKVVTKQTGQKIRAQDERNAVRF